MTTSDLESDDVESGHGWLTIEIDFDDVVIEDCEAEMRLLLKPDANGVCRFDVEWEENDYDFKRGPIRNVIGPKWVFAYDSVSGAANEAVREAFSHYEALREREAYL